MAGKMRTLRNGLCFRERRAEPSYQHPIMCGREMDKHLFGTFYFDCGFGHAAMSVKSAPRWDIF